MTIAELNAKAATVKNATAVHENTATRVGEMFEDIIDYLNPVNIGRAVRNTDKLMATKNDTGENVSISVDQLLKPLSTKAQLVQYSKNLFNPNSITYNYYVQYATGNTSALIGYATSDFIAVKPSTLYTKIKSDPNQEQLAYYDAEKNYVSGVATPTNSLTTPSNAYYIRLSLKIANDDVNTMMFAEGVVTTYEPFLQAIDKNTPVVIKSRNLFDKGTVADNYYVQYATGNLSPLSGYAASDFIAIKPNTLHSKIQYGDSEQLAFYDANKNYVSGLATIPTITFTTPSTAYFVRLSINKNTNQLDTVMLAEGDLDVYEPYDVRILDYDVFLKNTFKSVIIVAKTGGDYNTIHEAVAASNSSISNPVTIKIMPGIYNESVDIRYKYISLVGVDKTNCIIRTDTGDYFNPPINTSGGCSLTNLTIITTHDNPNFTIPAYAVHHDAESEGTSRITNCILISYQHAAIGIGLHNNQTLIVDNCEMYNYNDAVTEIQGALYCHNQQYAGAINQKLVVKNCRMESTKKCALRCEDANHLAGGSANDAKDTVYSFYNNILWSHDYGIGTGVVDGLGGRTPLDGNSWIGYLKLGVDSFGNNVSFINK